MRGIGLGIVALGCLLAGYVQLFELEGGISLFSILLFFGTCLPYLISGFLLFRIRRSLIPTCGALLPLISDAITFDGVFIHPQSSTAAISLVFMPVWNLLVSVPVGLLTGWGFSKIISLARRESSSVKVSE